jgi:hypothetical protein
MTSESGVLSFLLCWLAPLGVSKAASASYVYGGEEVRKGEGEKRKGKKNDGEENREGKRKRRRGGLKREKPHKING